MTIESITVKWAGPSKHNEKYGKILTDDDRWLDCNLALAQSLQKGAVVALDTFQNDKGYWKAKAPPGGAQPRQTDQGHPAKPNGATRPQQDTKAEEIFVCGVVNNGISSQQINPKDGQDVLAAVTAARYAWGVSFGGKGPPAEHQPQQAGAALPDGRPAAPFDLNDSVDF